MTRVRCSTCAHWSRRRGWCAAGQTYVRAPGAWRTCETFQVARPGLPRLADARDRLDMVGLSGLVLDLRDTQEGRLLRLRAGAPDDVRERVFADVGFPLRPVRPVRVCMPRVVEWDQSQATGSRAA